MQRLMLQTFSAPTRAFLLPLMFAILRERIYLDCTAESQGTAVKKNQILFFSTVSSPTKNSIKETTDSRFVENLSITLIDGFFRVEKVKNHVSYHAKYFAFFAITFINCNGYKMEKSTVFENQPKNVSFFQITKKYG